ncbi:MAG: esterase-like activity of phytase family protein [Acidobacteria bacterium]|nr:esterase-like activity of phytase family protein [Acidobacteriota bacterium]
MKLSQVNISKIVRNTSLGLCMAGGLWAQSGVVVETHVLPSISLVGFQNVTLPGSITTVDGGYKLGGIGSGLFQGPGDGKDIFWMITDRGPNPQDTATATTPIHRAWPVPQFTPHILKVQAKNGVITILQSIPLTGSGGAGVTGLPNESAAAAAYPGPLKDETAYGCALSGVFFSTAATNKIAANHDGHDTEDVVRDHHGNFWTVDEYGPSISKIDATGRVLKRFVPAGRGSVSGDHFTVVENLPAVLGRRPRNRGFEGVAITPNGKTLLAVVQSPLTNPSTAVGGPSRVIRIIQFDVDSEVPTAEYVYVMQSVTEFGATNPTEMKISGITALDEHRFLVLERTDAVAKLFKIDLRSATNILRTKWDDMPPCPSTPCTIEELAALETLETLAKYVPGTPPSTTDTLLAKGIVELPKELAVDLSSLRNPNGTTFTAPEKIEGVTVLSGKRIAISNDNDFQVNNGTETTAPTCSPVPSGAVQSQIMIVELDKPIK